MVFAALPETHPTFILTLNPHKMAKIEFETIIDGYGRKHLWNGKPHHEYEPAIFYFNTKVEEWYFMGVPHRENGPALVYPGRYELWYWYGLLHRVDGPAAVYAKGEKEWWWYGQFMKSKFDYEMFQKWMQRKDLPFSR